MQDLEQTETQDQAIEGFRLSPHQRHLWRLGGGEPDSELRSQCVVALEGAVDGERLAAALATLVERHESLRTTFRHLPGAQMPLQVIAEPGEMGVDLETDGEGDGEELPAVLAAEWSHPFDVEAGPLLRVRWLDGGAGGARVVLTAPALTADGRSLELLAGELRQLCADPDAGLDDAVQHVDVAEWLNELLESEETAAGREHWAASWDGAALRRTLPEMRATTADRPFAVHVVERSLDGEPGDAPHAGLLRRLETAAADLGVGEERLVLALWRALVWRLGGGTTLALRVPGRKFEELGSVVGPLAHDLPLAAPLRDVWNLAELVEDTGEAVDEVESWQEHFCWEGVESGGDEPFLPCAFDAATAGGAPAEGAAALRSVADRAAVLLRYRPSGEPRVELIHDASALDPAAGERLLDRWCALAAAALAAPERPVGELDLLGAEERWLLTAGFVTASGEEAEAAAAAAADDDGGLAHHPFEARVAAAPDAEAVRYGDTALTYRQLDERANRLAHELIARGIGPDDRVVVIGERSDTMVVTLLAVLKAGGCYLPIDAEYPQRRIGWMLEDGRPALVVTLGDVADALPDTAAPVVDGGELEAAAAERPAAAPPCPARPEHLAYVLFTSGSTGRPKAAMISHRNLRRHLDWMQGLLPLTADDRVVQKTPLGFDPSVWEIFAPLSAGAALEVARAGGHRAPSYLVELCRDRGVTVLRAVPTLLREIAAEPALEECTSLRAVLSGGEVLPPDLAALLRSRLDDARLINVYGPTEATIAATAWTVGEEEGSVPIGRPAAGYRAYVLSPEDLSPVPVGMDGELFLGGAGVGRGYLERPAMTAPRFLPDPFCGEPGERLYRTGDCARWRADGVLEFLGRDDHQVKLRGYRVELGEVERVVERHPGVAAAAARVWEAESGPLLVTYWTPAGDDAPSRGDLAAWLRERLPTYMVPGLLARLEAMPLAPSGKLDRRALPDPAEFRQGGEEGVPPRTPEEELLASIWGRVLRVERVGVRDNVFSLGADSIRALRVVALGRERGLEIPLTDIFQHQTVEKLALRLRRGEAVTATTEPFSLISAEDRQKLPDGVVDAYPLSSMQLGMLYHMRLDDDTPFYHNVNSFHLEARFSEEHLREAVRRVVARHPILRTSFDFDDYSEPLQLVHGSAELPVEVVDMRGWSADEQERAIEELVEEQHRALFDLSEPPQIRYFVHRASDERFWFTQVDNHAIVDGWSLTSILREVLTLHNDLLRNRPVAEEAPLETTFRDFIQLEREALDSDEHRSYFRDKLEGARPLRLPRLPEAPGADAGAGPGMLPVELPQEVVEGIPALGRETAVPVKSLCMTAHLKALAEITGQRDVVTGLPTHGRPETVDGDRVRGLFLNTVPFRLQLAADETWSTLAERVFANEREFLPYRRYPLSAIKRDRGGPDLFEVLFSFVEFHHAYQLMDQGEVRLLDDYKAWAFPHYVLMAGFNQHPPDGRLSMRLYYQQGELTDEQVRAYGELYRLVLLDMVRRPEGLHSELELPGTAADDGESPIEVDDLEQEFAF